MSFRPIPTSLPDIVLDGLKMSDFDILVDQLTDKEIYANTLSIPYPYTRKDALQFYNAQRRFENQHQLRKDWNIYRKGLLIGGIGLLYNHGVDSHKSEIGYWMSKAYRGKGMMSVILEDFIRFIFSSYPFERLEAHVFTHNPASCRILEKVGFKREGLVRGAFLKEHRLLDAYLYGLLKTDIELS